MAERTPSITSPSLSEGVDISPISTADRRNSLEKHLQTRPDEQDLKNRHILLDTNTAPALQARQLELERQRATDNLKKGLEKRPERGELVERKCCFCFGCVGGLVFLVLMLATGYIMFKLFCAHISVSRYISFLDYVTPLVPYH